MLSMLLVFVHLLATSMALGAIVATDLRLLAKLAQDRVRIAPPNEFVARIVMVALLLLYATGGAIVTLGMLERPDYLSNPKLQAKIFLVVLLTLNAFVLHRLTFPRLARGRRVARWHASDWIVVAVPVAISNFLWMFVAFLGIARPWNDTVPLRDILEIAAGLYIVAQCGVFLILAMAARSTGPEANRLFDKLKRSLASVGSLGRPLETARPSRSSRRSRSRREPVAEPVTLAANSASAPESVPGFPTLAEELVPVTASGALSARPALRLVGGSPDAFETTQRRAR
jgi:hypothetical protein